MAKTKAKRASKVKVSKVEQQEVQPDGSEFQVTTTHVEIGPDLAKTWKEFEEIPPVVYAKYFDSSVVVGGDEMESGWIVFSLDGDVVEDWWYYNDDDFKDLYREVPDAIKVLKDEKEKKEEVSE